MTQHKLSLEEVQGKQQNQAQEQKITKRKRQTRCGLRQGCGDINNFIKLNRIHQGTYGVVFRAKDPNSQQIVAIKKLKLIEGADFPITSLRQITILRSISHENIIKIYKVIGNQTRDRVFIVMEYMEHEIKQLLKVVKFNEEQIRRLMKDLLMAMDFLHQKNIVHRDLKTSNLLYSNKGILKVCDFGLARRVSQAMMTQQVISLRYRAPELLLDQAFYSTQIDMWSIGCIFAEFVLGQALFQGNTELEQLETIFKIVGSPTNQSWPGYKQLKNAMYIVGNRHLENKIRSLIPKQALSDQGVQLMKKMLTPYPKKRITAEKALKHDWFKAKISERLDMPSCEAINQVDRVKKKVKVQ